MNMDNVQVVKFNERFCGRKVVKEKPTLDSVKTDVEKSKVFNIKRARYEVMRFGLNGFDKEKQKSSKISMAIRLGAKPPKKEYVNYKVLMEEKLKQKAAQEAEQDNQYFLQKLKGRKKSRSRKQRMKNPSILT